MHIERAHEVTEEYYEVIQRLVPLLGSHKLISSKAEFQELIEANESKLLFARYPDATSPIVGMLTVSVYHVPTGVRSIIEDVVVDSEFRGKGVAKALIAEGIAIARNKGAGGVSLTSNPLRVEANGLYVSMGFEKRDTNSYYYKLK